MGEETESGDQPFHFSASDVFRISYACLGEACPVVKRSNHGVSDVSDAHVHCLLTPSPSRYLQEITNVCSLGEHPNIVKYYRAWQEDQHFYIQVR